MMTLTSKTIMPPSVFLIVFGATILVGRCVFFHVPLDTNLAWAWVFTETGLFGVGVALGRRIALFQGVVRSDGRW